MNRGALLAEVQARLDGRALVWFGSRGDDVASLADLDSLAHAFSVIAPYRGPAPIESWALEEVSGRRVDLHTYDVDEHARDPAVRELRAALGRVLDRPSAVFTYRPSSFLAAITLPRQDRCRSVGMVREHQVAFEHKPWVETAIAALRIAHVPWSYVAGDDRPTAARLLDAGPIMVRRCRTEGGMGIARVDRVADLATAWFEDEPYVSVAPFVADGVPVNVGAVVWPDRVTVHPASVQLIGIPGCTTLPYGYCGNDFGATLPTIGSERLDEIERSVVRVGDWLRAHGYVGAFGADFLVTEDAALFAEVNPRFQGSTHLSCRISAEAGESCLLLEHLGALLGCAGEPSRPLAVQAADHDLAHMVVRWTEDERDGVDPSPLLTQARGMAETVHVDVLTKPQYVTEREGTVARITVRDRFTTSGFELAPRWRQVLDDWGAAAHGAAGDDERHGP